MKKFINNLDVIKYPLLIVLFGVVLVLTQSCSWGIKSPIGSYGKVSSTVAGSTDMTMESQGTDAMSVGVSVNPTMNSVDVNPALNVTGVKTFVNKGTFYKSDIVGRAHSVNSSLLGEYSTADNASKEYAIEFYQSQSGSEFGDLIRGPGIKQSRASVPTPVSSEEVPSPPNSP